MNKTKHYNYQSIKPQKQIGILGQDSNHRNNEILNAYDKKSHSKCKETQLNLEKGLKGTLTMALLNS